MKERRIIRFDKVFKVFNTFLFIGFLLSTAFSKAWLSKVNIDLESTKKKVSDQEKLNESLSMKINELASIDNIQSVATNYGLEYNNSNIINLSNRN